MYTIYTQNKAFHILMRPFPLELWSTNEVVLTVQKKYKATPLMYSLKWYFYLRYSYLLGSEAPIRSINLVLFTSVEARNKIFQNFLSSHIYDWPKVHQFVNSITYVASFWVFHHHSINHTQNESCWFEAVNLNIVRIGVWIPKTYWLWLS